MITSVQNPLVRHSVKLRENRGYREEHGSVIVAGLKLIREIATQTPARKIFVENGFEISFKGEIHQVTHAVLKKITGLPAPEPIAAEFPLPKAASLIHSAPLLALDAIRDPGNLGTLIRTALAFGWAGVFFLPTCVDPFNDKVIRSSRAALFRLPWRMGSWEELTEIKEKNNLTAYIADTAGKLVSSIEPDKRGLLLLSNEAQGVRHPAEEFGQKITIPMGGDMESLNVAIAGGILMYCLGTGQK